MSKALWQPSAARVANANITAFAVRAKKPDYEDLHRWSLEQPLEFWRAVWDFTGMIGELRGGFSPGPSGMLDARMFAQSKLNVAKNLLVRTGNAPAIIARNEAGERFEVSWDQLRSSVMRAAGALRAAGVEPGDRVAAWLPLVPEAVVLALASAAIGATFSSTSPDFGVNGVLERFGQITPKVLVACRDYAYGGKRFDCLARLEEITAALPSVQRTVVLGLGDAGDNTAWLDWHAWLERSSTLESFEAFDFDQPLYVLFSSGTTGKPKCIVHRAGGVTLNLKKEHSLHCDIKPSDRVLYFTTTGWMMFNWLLHTLATGASIVLFDGNPTFPDAENLLKVVQDERVTLWGVSAKYIDALRKAQLQPMTHPLKHLRTLCSTGSPLSPEGFAWVYTNLKKDLHLASISGGTDICGCFALGNPTEAVYAGELQRPALGMAVDVWDENGASLRQQPGVRGELVCTQAFPSMPLRFWDDPHDQKYTQAYFAKYPGVWAHGDFASWTSHGGLVIHGRSDTTLNPGGVRIGTAEIYRVVENIPAVLEALVFGQEWQNDVRVVLLLRLQAGTPLNESLQTEIRSRIRKACTPRHVPAVILEVPDLPRTRSNKLVELALSDAVNGRPVRNTEALLNPEALWAIAARAELQR